MADTGHGATITFGTSGFSANVTNITFDEMVRPVVPTSHLATSTYDTSIPGDLVDPGGFTATLQYDPDEQPPITGAAETITVTYPIPAGMSNGATIQVSGFVDSFTQPELVSNTLMEATYHIKFAGTPTFADAS